ncbi:MAG: T9SS type A sorting domain-containing protein [Cryomorphaceae bacterium]|nr:T9SS type A sorting domain-containing protein [Cryomorphaceae bacterium]
MLCVLSLFHPNHSQAQMPLWSVGTQLVAFDGSSTNVSSLPTPAAVPGYPAYYVYNGAIPQNHQHVQFNDQGELLFFIVDGMIYNSAGYLILPNAQTTSNFEVYPNFKECNEIAITAIPGKCSMFLVFYSSHNLDVTSSEQSTPKYLVIDMLEDNHLWGNSFPQKGEVLKTEPESMYESRGLMHLHYSSYPSSSVIAFAGPNEDDFSHIFDPTDGAGKEGAIHFDIAVEQENTSFIIAVADQRDVSLTRFNSSSVSAPSIYNYSSVGTTRASHGEVELIKTGTSGFRLAWTDSHDYGSINTDEQIIYLSNVSNSLAITNTQDIILTAALGQQHHISGLEFSPSGQYLYYTKRFPHEIGYINTTSFSINDISNLIPNTSDYTLTKIEIGVDAPNNTPVIYFGSPNGFGQLRNVNTPQNLTWSSQSPMNNGINGVPLAIDAWNGSALFYNLHGQNDNIQAVADALSSQTCCLEMQNVTGVQGMSVNTTLDGTWTYASNPFGVSSGPVRIVDDLVFQTGTITTIDNMVFEFDQDADVIIEKGARVTLRNNSLWTAISCADKMWPGVNLLGTTNAQNSIDQFPTTGGDQGNFLIENSTIEYAMIGVEVGTTSLTGGGYLRATNSTFLNCRNGVWFRKYHYENTNENYVQNLSFFIDCTFKTDINYREVPAAHAQLYDVDGIKFLDCSFLNTNANNMPWWNRGTGIRSFRSSFLVEGENNEYIPAPIEQEPTTFYKLQYGIRSYGFNNPLAFYKCRNMEFQQCLYGITNYNTDNVQIYLNNFLLPDASGYTSNNTMERGIYLTNSTGYTVEQNVFQGFDDFTVNEDYPCALGIWVDNSGDAANEIRNNDFDEMKLGTYVTRNNRYFISGIDEPGEGDDDGTTDQTGLQLFCNTYSNGQTDIFRDANTLMRQDQGGNQGTTQNGLPYVILAGNRFSAPDCNGFSSDFVVDPQNVFYNVYWSHSDANTIPDCGGTSNVQGPTFGMDLLTNSESLVPYNDLDCPNRFEVSGGGHNPSNIAVLVDQLNAVKTELETARNTYNQVVDDNQKQSTLDVLSEAFPQESQYYRDLLIQRYPLSNEVLRKMIAQSERLSSWHLTEILLVNSPLNKEILFEIENSDILSDFFMSFLYNADSGASLRRLMEQNILGLASERDQLIQAIANAGLNYEADSEIEAENPLYFQEYLDALATQNGSTALRIRAANYASRGAYLAALELIENEPLLTSYAEILQLEQAVNGDWSSLNEAQISYLWNIYNTESDYSNSLALSILQEIGAVDFEPEPRVPIQFRSLELGNNKTADELPLLGVWPNPASGSAWLHYPIEADDHGTIQLFDPQGRLVDSFQPKSNGLVELKVDDYESGVYIVQLVAFNKIVETIKFTVVSRK